MARLLILLSVQLVLLPLALLTSAVTPITLLPALACYYFQISGLMFFASSSRRPKTWKQMGTMVGTAASSAHSCSSRLAVFTAQSQEPDEWRN